MTNCIKTVFLAALILSGCNIEDKAVEKRKIDLYNLPEPEKPVTDKMLNLPLLMGKWVLDQEELFKEFKRNIPSEKEADGYIQQFKKQNKLLGMQFFPDNRFLMLINDEEYMGFWELSSDKESYSIKMADDYIELHEVLELTEDRLVELPVAELRKAGAPADKMVYKRVE